MTMLAYNVQTLTELNSTTSATGLDMNTTDGTTQLPADMQFGESSLISVVCYSILFVVSAMGNLTVFITLFRNRKRKSRVNLFIMHLCIADLIVTFIMLPLETIWGITVGWYAGDAMCRILMFFRAFGFYLGSFILVCISLDRYFAILHPLSLSDADRRGRIMITLAWTFSFIASTPQSVIFHVERHPQFLWFTQCLTFNFFPTRAHEMAYNVFNVATIYLIPLIVIVISYLAILWEISKKAHQSKEEIKQNTTNGRQCLRRSGVGKIQQARIKTLKMTVVIVSVFVMCWTPYYVISCWWWFDEESATRIDKRIQNGLFLFAVSNSCMDPIVYGMFTIDFRRELTRCCRLWRNTARTSYTLQYSMNATANSEVHVNESSSEHRTHKFQVQGQGQVEVTLKTRGNVELTPIGAVPGGRRSPRESALYKGQEVPDSLSQLSSPITPYSKKDRNKKRYDSQFV